MTVGNKLVITPRITLGHLLMKLKNGATSVKYDICEMEPTTATGMDLSGSQSWNGNGLSMQYLPENDESSHKTQGGEIANCQSSPGDA